GEEILSPKITFILIGLVVFFFPLIISRISRYERVIRHRMITVVIFAFFTIFFWMSFEQGASSLVIFARDFTDRILEGSAATTFLVIDLLLTFIPLIIITWVLVKLWGASAKIIRLSNIILVVCFMGIWGLAIWKTNRDLNTKSYELTVAMHVTPDLDKDGKQKVDKKTGELLFAKTPVTVAMEKTLTDSDS